MQMKKLILIFVLLLCACSSREENNFRVERLKALLGHSVDLPNCRVFKVSKAEGGWVIMVNSTKYVLNNDGSSKKNYDDEAINNYLISAMRALQNLDDTPCNRDEKKD